MFKGFEDDILFGNWLLGNPGFRVLGLRDEVLPHVVKDNDKKKFEK